MTARYCLDLEDSCWNIWIKRDITKDQMGLWRYVLCLVFVLSVTATAERNSTLKHSERRGKALKISKKPCTDPSGRKGICTFKWDCINNNGTLMGTCVDGFIFGTCCQYDYDPLLHDSPSISYHDTNKIVDDPWRSQTTRVASTTPSSTTSSTTTKTTTPAPKWPIQIILPTLRPAVTTVRPATASTSSNTPSGQLVTWTSIGPTRSPQRPIILQPFPFRPGSNFPGIQGGWPMGVAFPVDPFQINRPLQVFRPPVLLQSAQNNVASQVPARGNASYTILNGPDGTSQNTTTSTKTLEMTTVSVPIPQWSTTPPSHSSIQGDSNKLDIMTVRPSLITSANFSTTGQSSSSSTGKPIRKHLDYRKDCGVRGITSKARIVGGQSAYFGRWPWQVLVKEAAWLGLYQKNKCGGVLVSSRYAITAGHCQPGRFLSALVVILGEYDLLTDLERMKPEMRRVKRMIVHRHYNPQNFDNDIALLELDPPVVYKPHISPICLPEPGEDFTGKVAYVTGWGKTAHGGAIPNLLQEVQVPIMSNPECVKMFKEAGHTKLIKDTFLCAGYKTGGKDSCEGDSGGPLMVERENGQWVLAGTVSHGIRCADPNLPGVYMKISAYRTWIDKIIK